MADVTVTVSGATSDTVDDVIEQVTAKAAEMALADLQAIWPVRTGRSRDGLRATADAVVGSAPYTDDVKQRGSATPIADSDAGPIGDTAAARAVSESDISQAMGGVIASILAENLET